MRTHEALVSRQIARQYPFTRRCVPSHFRRINRASSDNSGVSRSTAAFPLSRVAHKRSAPGARSAASFLAALPTTASSDNPQDEQKHDSPYRGRDDSADRSRANANAQLRERPRSDEGADNSNDDVPNDTKACPLNKLTGKPSSKEAHDQITTRPSFEMVIASPSWSCAYRASPPHGAKRLAPHHNRALNTYCGTDVDQCSLFRLRVAAKSAHPLGGRVITALC
jgi:hypothetical protein